MIVSVSGYNYTGSSAVIDLLENIRCWVVGQTCV